jgi:lysosomal acid phosphatase
MIIFPLFAGPLVGQVIKHMMEKRDGIMKPDYKLTMYSAHDITVANFLMALGVFDPQSPPYRSLILIELWKNDQGEFQVKVRINEIDLCFAGISNLCTQARLKIV